MNNAIKKYVEDSLKQLAEQPPAQQVVEESLEAHLLRFCKYLKGLQCGCKLGEEDAKFIWGNLVCSLAEGLEPQFFSSGTYLWAHDHKLSSDEWALYDLLNEAGKLKKVGGIKVVWRSQGKKGKGKKNKGKGSARQTLRVAMKRLQIDDKEGEASSSSSSAFGGAVRGTGVNVQWTMSSSSLDSLPSLEKVTYLRKMVDVLKITTRQINQLMIMEKRADERLKEEFASLMARSDSSMASYMELKSFVTRLTQLQMEGAGPEFLATLKSKPGLTVQGVRDIPAMTDSPMSPTPPTSPVLGDPDMNDYRTEVTDEVPSSAGEGEGSVKNGRKEELKGVKGESEWEKADDMLNRMARAIPESSDRFWSIIDTFLASKSYGLELGDEEEEEDAELDGELDNDDDKEDNDKDDDVDVEEVDDEEVEEEEDYEEEEEEDDDEDDDIVKEKTLPQSSISIKKYGTPASDSSKASKVNEACPHIGCPPPQAHYRDWKRNDFKCICGVKFRNMAYLEKHVTVAKATATFKCDQCPFKVNRKCCLAKHKEDKHEVKPKQTRVACQLYECTRGCGKLFSTKGKMFEHQVKTGRACKFANADNPKVPKCSAGFLALRMMNITAKNVVDQINEMSEEDLTNPEKVSQEDQEAVKVVIAIKKQKLSGGLMKEDDE